MRASEGGAAAARFAAGALGESGVVAGCHILACATARATNAAAVAAHLRLYRTRVFDGGAGATCRAAARPPRGLTSKAGNRSTIEVTWIASTFVHERRPCLLMLLQLRDAPNASTRGTRQRSGALTGVHGADTMLHHVHVVVRAAAAAEMGDAAQRVAHFGVDR